jgi:uncharacterized membrane protein
MTSTAMWMTRLRSHLHSSLWFVPVLCVAGGAALSFGTLALDRAFDYEALPRSLVGGPEAAISILETVATSMVSLAALVLTITMVVVQLAMAQFSPRIVQRVLQDKPSQLAIGLFVATFVHAILALREVSTESAGGAKVPGIAVVTAFVLVVLSIAVLVIYVHHIGRSLRVSALIELVGRDTRALVDKVYSGDLSSVEAREAGTIPARRSGVITTIAYDELVEEASRADCRIEMLVGIGEFVPAGAPLFRIDREVGRIDADRLLSALHIQLERTLENDVAYGVRLLVDIAARSLADSPFQDPSTTVQALDRIHDILRQLVHRPFPDGRHRDAQGTVRLTVRSMSWEAYVHLAFDEIRMAGGRSPQVTRRLVAALNDLRSIAPAERRAPLEEQLGQLRVAVEGSGVDRRDQALLLDSDIAGLGVASGTADSGH